MPLPYGIEGTRGSLRSRVPSRCLGALVALVVLAVCGVFSVVLVRGATREATPPLIRVNQAGYVINYDKVAYLVWVDGRETASVRVIDVDNEASVLSFDLADSVGSWNETYNAVYPLDISDLRVEGSYLIRVMASDGMVVESPEFVVAPAAEIYSPLAASMTQFFQAQRDGENVVTDLLHRVPSHLGDAEAEVYTLAAAGASGDIASQLRATGEYVDLSGGWFDAGDYLKFTATMSYALDNLLMAYRESQASGSENANEDLLSEIDYGLTWLTKAWDPESGVLYAQVGLGDGNSTVLGDHDVWRLPEADGKWGVSRSDRGDPRYFLAYRPALRANEPGTTISPNLAGRTAAAFALAAQVHADADPERADHELELAASLYTAAATGSDQSDQLTTVYPREYYPETSWLDDMALGAVELALAGSALGDSRTDEWIAEATRWGARYAASDDRGVLSLYDVGALALLDLVTIASDNRQEMLYAVKTTLEAAVEMSEEDIFNSGVSYWEGDSTAREFGLMVTAVEFMRRSGDSTYLGLALEQAGWVLGANSWGSTFVTGVGEIFPRCLQHQIANLNPDQILVGAAVNGPASAEDWAVSEESDPMDGMTPCSASVDSLDGRRAAYHDDVRAWHNTEPTLDATSGGLLAFTLLGLSMDLGSLAERRR